MTKKRTPQSTRRQAKKLEIALTQPAILNALGRAVTNSSLDRCAYQRTRFFWPTPADLAFARRLCAREGLPRKDHYFDLPW
jgi:hypothetical protein